MKARNAASADGASEGGREAIVVACDVTDAAQCVAAVEATRAAYGGRVDLPGVFAALRDVNFGGWAIVELDRVPDPSRTAKDAAEVNKRYLVETMHQTI